MYTRKRHRGGALEPKTPHTASSRASNRISNRSSRTYSSRGSMFSRQLRSSSRIHLSSGLNAPKRKRKTTKIPCLTREGSLALRVICSKNRFLRTCRVYKACRFTMLEKIALSILLPVFEEKGITDPVAIRNRLNKIIPLLLEDKKLYKFIMMNESEPFQGEDVTIELLRSFTEDRGSVEQIVIPCVILRKRNGIIGHYFLLICENGIWYYYGSYGSDLVSISPAKIEIDIDEFLKFVRILNEDTMPDDDAAFVEMYVETVFLPKKHRQQSSGEDESGSSTRAFFMDIQKGIKKETGLYIRDAEFKMLYIPGLYEHVEKVLIRKEIPELITSKPSQANSRMNTVPENGTSTFSAVSANGGAEGPGHMRNTSDP